MELAVIMQLAIAVHGWQQQVRGLSFHLALVSRPCRAVRGRPVGFYVTPQQL
jgi:hypothetical protein